MSSPGGGPTADVSVRVGWADDATGLAEVQARAWRRAYDGLLPDEVLAAVEPQDLAAAWHTSMNHPQDARNRVMVALERNTIRGFAITGPASDPDCNPIVDGEISEFTIDPEQTRHGHGSRLVQACAETLRSDRFTRAVLWLNSTDDISRGFFTEAGWAPDGAHRELALHGDASVTVKQVRLHTDLSEI